MSQGSFGQCRGEKGKDQEWASDATQGTGSALMRWGLFPWLQNYPPVLQAVMGPFPHISKASYRNLLKARLQFPVCGFSPHYFTFQVFADAFF